MKIETNIPIPFKGRNETARRLKYPINELKVGDCLTCDDQIQFRRARHAACVYWDKNIEFISRGDSLRIWRVK